MRRNKKRPGLGKSNIKEFCIELIGKEPSFKDKIIFEDNKYYLADQILIDLKLSISRSFFSAGLILGEINSGYFHPSLELIRLLSLESDKKVYIGKKAEWLFLCGRDVFSKSVKKKTVDDDYLGYVFVQNLKDENLGFGDFSSREITKIYDRGDFLRRE